MRGSSTGAGTSSASSRTPSSPAGSGDGTVRWRRRGQPAAQQLGFGAGAADRDLLAGDAPASARRARSARQSAILRPRDVGDRGALEVLRQSVAAGARSHSTDESTITRSATVTSCSHCVSPGAARSRAPAQEHRQVGDREAAARSMRRREEARSPRSESSITSPTTARSPTGNARTDKLGVDSTLEARARDENHGARRMPLAHPLQSPLGCVEPLRREPRRHGSITLVRWSADRPPADSPRRSRASSDSTCPSVTSTLTRLRRPVPPSSMPTPWNGRRGRGARRTTAAPTSRPSSSGMPPGRATSRRPSHRRSPTRSSISSERVNSVASPSIASRMSLS